MQLESRRQYLFCVCVYLCVCLKILWSSFQIIQFYFFGCIINTTTWNSVYREQTFHVVFYLCFCNSFCIEQLECHQSCCNFWSQYEINHHLQDPRSYQTDRGCWRPDKQISRRLMLLSKKYRYEEVTSENKVFLWLKLVEMVLQHKATSAPGTFVFRN